MDFEVDLGALEGKSADLESLTSSVKDICNDCNNSYLSKLSSSEISSICAALMERVARLEKGYNNSNSWLKRYVSELSTTEKDLANYKGANVTVPVAFTSSFTDLFTKITAPLWTTTKQNERKQKLLDSAAAATDAAKKQEEPVADGSIAAKKKAFIGDINDTSKYYKDPHYPNMQKDLRCFNNKTGEEITDNQTIHLKVGETIVLTCALPYNAGVPKRIIRTTAADVSSQSDKYKITSSKSNISGDPNNIQYVNYQYNHWPSGVDLHTNYYEWIIHADKPGKRQISQTCEYESSAGTPKSMIGINIVID